MRRKKEASKVKQTTMQSNTAHPRQSLFQLFFVNMYTVFVCHPLEELCFLLQQPHLPCVVCGTFPTVKNNYTGTGIYIHCTCSSRVTLNILGPPFTQILCPFFPACMHATNTWKIHVQHFRPHLLHLWLLQHNTFMDMQFLSLSPSTETHVYTHWYTCTHDMYATYFGLLPLFDRDIRYIVIRCSSRFWTRTTALNKYMQTTEHTHTQLRKHLRSRPVTNFQHICVKDLPTVWNHNSPWLMAHSSWLRYR